MCAFAKWWLSGLKRTGFVNTAKNIVVLKFQPIISNCVVDSSLVSQRQPGGEQFVGAGTWVFEPGAPPSDVPQQSPRTIDGLAGKVIGFIDNAKPNFNNLVDDLAELMVTRYGAAA